jgi:hypothetical protein
MDTMISPPATNGNGNGNGNAATHATTVRLPGGAIDPAGKDLARPTADLLREVAVLETQADAAHGVTVAETPQSLQVITAGVLSATKLTGGLTAAGGLGGAVTAFVASFSAQDVALKIALIAAGAVILAAAAIAVARIVSSDVDGRASASVAQYEARASIVESLYQLLAATSPPAAALATPGEQTAANVATRVVPAAPAPGMDLGRALLSAVSAYPTAVRLQGDCSFVETNGLRYGLEGLQVRLLDGDWVGLDRVDQFRPA